MAKLKTQRFIFPEDTDIIEWIHANNLDENVSRVLDAYQYEGILPPGYVPPDGILANPLPKEIEGALCSREKGKHPNVCLPCRIVNTELHSEYMIRPYAYYSAEDLRIFVVRYRERKDKKGYKIEIKEGHVDPHGFVSWTPTDLRFKQVAHP